VDGSLPCKYSQKSNHLYFYTYPTYATLRRKHWPEYTAATEKLYGAREELQRTAAFIEKTGLTI
jgi:hypothetical protein